MSNKVFGYIRVSSNDQSIDRQVEVIKPLVKSERDIFIDKQSGKDFNREQYQALKAMLRRGDSLIIKELDRLGRNADEMKREWQSLQKNGIKVKVVDMPILDTTEAKQGMEKLISNIVFELLAYIAQKERETMKQRQAEGIKIAKDKGIKFGRPKAELPEGFVKYFNKLESYEITASKMMEALHMKRTTFYKLLAVHLGGEEKYNKWKYNRKHYRQI